MKYLGWLTNIGSSIFNTGKKMPRKSYSAFKDVKKSVSFSKKKWDSMTLFFYGNKCRMLPARISNDYKEVVPKGTQISVKNEHSYLLEPENLEIFLINLDNIKTWRLDDIPKNETIDRMIEKLEYDEDNKLIKTYNVEQQTYKGAQELNRRAYSIYQTALLRFMEEPQRKELFLIILSSIAFGTVCGFIVAIMLGA